MKETNKSVWKLGEILVHQGWLDWTQLEHALEVQRQTGHFIGEIAAQQGFIGKKEASILYLGEILIRNQWVSWEAIGKALFLQREDDRMLGDILLENNWVETNNLYQALAIQHNMPFVDLNQFTIPLEALKLVPRHIALERRILPLQESRFDMKVAGKIEMPLDRLPLRRLQVR